MKSRVHSSPGLGHNSLGSRAEVRTYSRIATSCVLIGMLATFGFIAGCPVSPPPNGDPPEQPVPNESQTVTAGVTVLLDGTGSTDPDGDALNCTWEQRQGPDVLLSDRFSCSPTFTAPDVDDLTVLVFELTVDDGELTDSDEVVITVLPPSVLISATWADATADVTIDLKWRLPSGELVPINAMGWARNGAESVRLLAENVPDGLHWVTLEFRSRNMLESRYADVEYTLDFLGYRFEFADRIETYTYRGIGVDFLNGVGLAVYNGWLPASDPGAGTPTGRQVLEVQAGWRDATGDVQVDISLQLPSGETVPRVFDHGWGTSGFERIVIPEGVELADGVYELHFTFRSRHMLESRFADITYHVRFPGYSFDTVPERMGTSQERAIQIEVSNGVATVLANSW